ncbi:MAG: sigma-70 family RNA polymerase sigma factor [Fischerella sp.]|nr:sigma-70 family RNA polymerase sigma factor [Fischerella sp.]
MKKRENIIEKFSTFLSFRNSNSEINPIWQTDLELERYMKLLVRSEPEANEEFWARYFLKILREVSQSEGNKDGEKPLTPSSQHSSTPPSLIAGKHLSAYLQEACLWASQKAYQRFKYLRHKYPLEEYFQIANSAANPPAKLFKSFNSEHPQTNVEGYAKTAIIRLISNTIYQQDLEAKRGKFSDYGLLKDLTAKELKEALISKGFSVNQIDSYCLAWQCFDKIYQPDRSHGSRSLATPTQQHLQQIAFCYNQRLKKLDLPTALASGEKIQQMLSICIQAARDYRTKRFLPLEAYDNISDPMPTPWDHLIQEDTWEQLQLLVSNLFATMPEAGQTMLKLWQGLSFTQAEIAVVLKDKYPELQKQYQVARQLDKYSRNLLKDLANEWKKNNPDIYLRDDKDIQNLKDAMTEYLQSHCQKLFYLILDKIAEQPQNQGKLLILCRQINQLKQLNEEPRKPGLSEISNNLAKIKQDLIINFQQELEISMNLAAKTLDIGITKIANFVHEWLRIKIYLTQQG